MPRRCQTELSLDAFLHVAPDARVACGEVEELRDGGHHARGNVLPSMDATDLS